MSVVRDLRVLLRLHDFRRLLTLRLLSQGADGVYQVALATYVVFSPEKQTSPAAIASAMAVLLLPYSLVGPFAGVLLDRWRRRQVFLYGNLLRVLLAFVTATLMLSHTPDWLFYASALCVTAVNRFVLSGLSAALPRVVDAERLVMANSISPTAGTLAATLGGGLAFGVRLIAADSDAAVVLIGALLYLCAALASLRMDAQLLGPDPELIQPRLGAALTGTARDLSAGVRHLVSRSSAARALAAMTVMRFCYGALLVMVLMLCRYAWSSTESEGLALLGLAMGVSGAGFFVAAAITPAAVGRFGAAGWIALCRRHRIRTGARPGSHLRTRADRGGCVRPGPDHTGREDRHRHGRAVLHRRRLPRPDLLRLRRAGQRVLRRRGRSGGADAAAGRPLGPPRGPGVGPLRSDRSDAARAAAFHVKHRSPDTSRAL